MATDDFYRNPLDGRPLVARPRGPARKKKGPTSNELAFAQREAVALHAKGYSPRQIARGLAAVGVIVPLEQVELWLFFGAVARTL